MFKSIVVRREEGFKLRRIAGGLRSAQRGLLTKIHLLLSEDVVQRMVREIPNAKRVDVEGTNHYSILFQPNKKRDQAILEFLK